MGKGAPIALNQDLPEKTLEAQLQDLERELRELPTYKRLDRWVAEQRIKILRERIRNQDQEEIEVDEQGHWQITVPSEHPTVRLAKAKSELVETPESRPALRRLRERQILKLENEIRVLNGEPPLPLPPDDGIAKRALQELKGSRLGVPIEGSVESEPASRIGSDSHVLQTLVAEQTEYNFAMKGLHPAAALVMALWYGVVAASAMSRGFAYLYEHSNNDYPLAQGLMWIVGIGIGISVAVCLARGARWTVGVVASGIMSCLLLSLLFLIPNDQPRQVSLFGFRSSASNFMIGVAILTLLSGLLGTGLGMTIRADETWASTILGIHRRHWFWLWLALYAWVAIIPTAIYYVWLEVISTGFVFTHPWLLLDDAWTGGWTVTFGFAGFAAILYGVGLSLESISAVRSTNVQTRRRVLRFLLGTLIMVGPVANILFRLAIHSLKQLPDGITANPWWILR